MALRLSTGLRNALLGSNSFKTIMQNGVIRVFSGVQPTSADDAEAATVLLEVTVSSGTFTPGTATSGINFAAPRRWRPDQVRRRGLVRGGLDLRHGRLVPFLRQ